MLNKSKFKLSFYLLVLVFAVAVGASTIVFNQQQKNEPVAQQPVAQVETPERTRTEITYTAKAGITSLQQLQDEADNIVVKETEFGRYVDAIEGHAGNTDGKYWSFYIDGKLAEVGADAYIQKGGEKIEWKFQKL